MVQRLNSSTVTQQLLCTRQYMSCRDPWPCVLEEFSVLDDGREKRRSSWYEINPVSYENHSSSPESFLSLSLDRLFPRFIMLFSLTLFHHTLVNVWKFVIGLCMLLTTICDWVYLFISFIFSLHQSLSLKCQRMPMVNREFTGLLYQYLNTVANSVIGSGKGRISAAKFSMAT